MKPYEELASTRTPDGVQLTLLHRSGDYYIEIDGEPLMSTRETGSERALAELAIERLGTVGRPCVLVGGLGLGFTLGAALDVLPGGATVVVAEKFQPVIQWNRKFCFESPKDRLADPRVVVDQRDVVDVLREATRAFDAVLLDVDNGPDAFCLGSNHRLYNPEGLGRILKALRPEGILAVWSAGPSPAFPRQLRTAGFHHVDMTVVRSRGRKGAHHQIFLGRKPRKHE